MSFSAFTGTSPASPDDAPAGSHHRHTYGDEGERHQDKDAGFTSGEGELGDGDRYLGTVLVVFARDSASRGGVDVHDGFEDFAVERCLRRADFSVVFEGAVADNGDGDFHVDGFSGDDGASDGVAGGPVSVGGPVRVVEFHAVGQGIGDGHVDGVEIAFIGNSYEEGDVGSDGDRFGLAGGQCLLERQVEVGRQAGVVACLLYTSPSPRDATLSRMPSSA